MQKNYLLFSIVVLLVLSSSVALAQKPVKTVTLPSAARYKKTVVKTTLGKATGSISLSAVEAGQLITLPLKITDDKNIDYVISSYQFAYKRIGVTEDEQTGKTSVQTDMAADRFTVTPLPPVWQKNIIDGLHKGEELYFFDIIVFDKQRRRFFAPELKILIN
ncbi:MAG: hypothetical protein ABIN01_05320 [Ferruginibacter sp.]